MAHTSADSLPESTDPANSAGIALPVPDVGDQEGGAALAVLDGETVIFCNAATLRLFGGSADDFVGKTAWEISPLRTLGGVADQSASRQYIREAYEQGHLRFDWEHRRPDGSTLLLDVSLSRIDLPEGPRMVIAFRDVSGVVSAQGELRSHIEFQSFLAAISNTLVTAERDGLDNYINDSLRRIGERYDLDMVRLWWNLHGADAVSCSHDWARDGKTVAGYRVAISRVSWANKKLWSGVGYHCKSLDEYPAEARLDREYTEQEGIKSLLVTPIILGDQVYGAASYSIKREERDWPQQTVQELELLTRLLGSAWKREEYIRQVRDSEAELRRSQQMAQVGTFVETAAEGASLRDDYGDLHMSLEACEVFGLEPGSETTEEMLSRVHPDDYEHSVQFPVPQDGEKGAIRLNYRVIRRDGSEIRVKEWAEVEYDAVGNPIRWFGTVQDVTGQWQARERLRLQNQFQKRLVRISQVFMSGSYDDIDRKLHKALQNIGEAYGIDRINILKVHADTGRVDRVYQWAKGGFSDEISSMDLRIAPWSCGKILDGQSSAFRTVDELPDDAEADRDFYRAAGIRSRLNVPVFADNKIAGSVSFLMVNSERGWTERIRNELSLFVRVVVTAWYRIKGIRLIESHEAELLRSQRVAHVGSYVEAARPGTTLDDSLGISRLSDEASAMFQIESGEESLDLVTSRVHPDDRERFVASVNSLDQDVTVKQHEYRILRPDGSIIHVEDRMEVDRNEEGKIVRLFGTVMDVTSRVESNLRLQEAMEEIEQLKDQLQDENIYLRKEVQSANREKRLIGDNPQFVSALIAADKVAPTDVTVLILGETGTGKELVAREIHQNSVRSDTPLISVNCAALSSELIESELFGHEAGAFTGADKARKGRFELADGGTLFLDEIGDLPADVQAKILRALQTGEFERLGGMRTLKVDVRLITATNRNLHEMVRAGSFRADLFYRINSFPIVVPALRDRSDDIALLANHFVEKHALRLGKRVQSIAPQMIRRMQAMDWPGNVRELEGFIQRALIATSDTILDYSDSDEAGDEIDVPDLDAVQHEHIVRVLERCNWIVGGAKGAAAVLGVPPSTLRSRMGRLGIERPR